jgi:integrase
MPKLGAVKLFKQIKINGAWKLAPALFDSKGRVRRDHVRVQGRDEIHEEGMYYLESWNAGKRTREAVGPDAFLAAKQATHKHAERSAVRSGIVTPANDDTGDRIRVKDALQNYEDNIRYHRSLRTFRTYRPIIRAFGDLCPRTYIDQIDRQELVDFGTHFLKQGQKGKTVYNKLVVICQMLKTYGRGKLFTASDWPSFVETVRPIYEDEDLTNLFAACEPDEAMRFRFYLMSGFRDAEGRFVTWRDVDFKNMAVRVTAKPHWNFQPKNWEEREVPVPQKLIALLKAFRPQKAGPDDPLFPTTTGRPDGAMLEKLKEVAWRGKLNCGRCATSHKLDDGTTRINRCSSGPFCTRWFLHKFRHTYATRHLQDGIDIRTLQTWMGHRDIASTMVYLKGVRNSDIQSRLNQGSIAAFG